MAAPKSILVLNGHPAPTSLSKSLSEAYIAGAQAAGHDLRVHHLHDMKFDPDYGFAGYDNPKRLEPDLEAFLADLEWCQHLVVTMPLWWGGMPAKLKGLVDRAFLPGRTFSTRKTNLFGVPTPLMTGRSARVILTTDTPAFFLRLMYGNAIKRTLRGQVLGFIGLRPLRYTQFAPATHAKSDKVETWQGIVKTLGSRGA